MKIRFFLVGLLLTFCAFSFAQETVTYGYGYGYGYDEEYGSEPNSSIWTDWFVQLGVGGQTFLGDFSKFNGVISRATLMPSFAVGKWWSPYWGTRLQFQGGALHNFPTNDFMQKDTYSNLHLDVMCNLLEYFDQYEFGVFSFIPYAGLGTYWRGKVSDDNNLLEKRGYISYPEAHAGVTIHAGALFQFRLNDAISCHLDVAGTLLTDDYLNRWTGGVSCEGVFSVSAGLTLNLGEIFP